MNYFEGVCVTTVILAPGAYGREVRTCTPTPHFRQIRQIRFKITGGSFLLSKIRFLKIFFGKWSPFLGLSSQAPSWRQDGPRCNLDRPWSSSWSPLWSMFWRQNGPNETKKWPIWFHFRRHLSYCFGSQAWSCMFSSLRNFKCFS